MDFNQLKESDRGRYLMLKGIVKGEEYTLFISQMIIKRRFNRLENMQKRVIITAGYFKAMPW